MARLLSIAGSERAAEQTPMVKSGDRVFPLSTHQIQFLLESGTVLTMTMPAAVSGPVMRSTLALPRDPGVRPPEKALFGLSEVHAGNSIQRSCVRFLSAGGLP